MLKILFIFCFLVNYLYSQDLPKESIYQRPYSSTENQIDYDIIKGNMWTMGGASLITLGALYLAPSSFTNWDKSEADSSNLFRKWKQNVSDGPVMDKDDFFLNYVTHPYSGAIYYMGARSAGANIYYSFLFSTLLSTFFWEYGIEAFAEIPSKQDLIITPVAGSIFGEGFYLVKRHIVANDGKLLSSKVFGSTISFIIDPLTEVSSLFRKTKNKKMDFSSYPVITSNNTFGYRFKVNF
jgi:hypothetical protein